MVSVTVVTWNSEKYLRDCFAALATQDYRDLEVTIVDNASEDGTRAILKDADPAWHVIYNDKNVGFAAGQNQAIRASRGNFVLCLNPDVMLSPNFITQLMSAAGESCFDAGVFCGKLLRWDPTGEPRQAARQSAVPKSADAAPKEGSYQGTTSVVPKASPNEEGFSPCTDHPQGLKPIASSDDTALKRHGFQPCHEVSPKTRPLGPEGELPQGLKPGSLASFNGAPEGVPLQDTPQGLPLQTRAFEKVSPVSADPRTTNIIDSTGIYFTPNMRHLDRGAEEIDRGQYDRPQYVFGATGAAAFYRRSFIDDVSVEGEFFDEDFFAFREDGDLSWRAQLMGWKCLYLPTAVAWHVRRVTPERRKDLPLVINWHSAKNRFLMRGKNASGWLCWRLFFPVLSRDAMTFGYAVLRDRRLLSAVTYWWKVRDSVRRKRRIIQSRRRVSDRELVWWFSNTPRAQDAPEPPPHSAISRQQSARQP
jgi:GT2 family glycosyltransferase